ncbi:hypothetical protein [Salinibacterium sp. PAMC 21357]|uniref:hypothetical protein n=1 Tax=Salinibacterium sp. PAMC 21357 TaxID=1112215 RepID=UPI000289AD79|nr:hypothetical protein [Salinibacterium sp. PAMC 21357]
MDSSLSVREFADADAESGTGVLHAAYAEVGARGLNYTAVDQDSHTTLVRARGGQCWVVERDARIATIQWPGKTYDSVVMIRPLEALAAD